MQEGRSREATGSRTLFHKVILHSWNPKSAFQPGELLLQVEDPVVIKIKVKQPSGGGSQVAVGGKINHQAQRLVPRQAEVEMIFMFALKKVAGISRKG